MAATACGLFESGSFAGGGIASATKRALDTQFIGVPHSGMIYTPPSYSDHIAVSLLLKDDSILNGSSKLELMNDASTRKAQPHKRQRSISSFFSSGTTTAASTSSSSSTSTSTVLQPDVSVKKQRISSSSEESTTVNEPPKKKGLYSFFGKSNTVKNKE